MTLEESMEVVHKLEKGKSQYVSAKKIGNTVKHSMTQSHRQCYDWTLMAVNQIIFLVKK